MENNKSQGKVVVDANIFVALYYLHDPLHERAIELLKNIKSYPLLYITNNYIISESVTVILLRSKSLKLASSFARMIYQKIDKWFNVEQVTKSQQVEASRIFTRQRKYKGDYLSFSDCVLITQARKQKIKTVLTFDKTFKQFEKKDMIVLP